MVLRSGLVGSKKAGLLGPAFLLVFAWSVVPRSVADDGEAPLAGAVGEADGVVAGCQCGEVELALACGLGAPAGGLEGAALEVQDGDSEVEDVGAEVEVDGELLDLTGACGLDGGVECQQICLLGDIGDETHDCNIAMPVFFMHSCRKSRFWHRKLFWKETNVLDMLQSVKFSSKSYFLSGPNMLDGSKIVLDL